MTNFFKNKVAVITGSAGFIGYHYCKKLLDQDWIVVGVDNFSTYYNIKLKLERNKLLCLNKNFIYVNQDITRKDFLKSIFKKYRPSLVSHFAAQAGVRYSIDDPGVYIKTNINGSFELLEAARRYPPDHLFIASTSSVYGANENQPFKEVDKTDHQVSIYAATKKSVENLAHTYSHLFDIPTTVLRFFTVYGPWGRPDMALFKFTEAILDDKPIDVYNNGNMLRDFTYIDDVMGLMLELLNKRPERAYEFQNLDDSLSPIANYRVLNIAMSKPVKLKKFIEIIEQKLNITAKINYMPMQPGDVHQTWAHNGLIKSIVKPPHATSLEKGISNFVDWYISDYERFK